MPSQRPHRARVRLPPLGPLTMQASTSQKTTEESPDASSKKPTASLLPAFEPLSSSPVLPRPLKRSRDVFTEDLKYPTPVPTSSTAVPSSSPPQIHSQRPPSRHENNHNRSRLQRAISERAPLADVPSIILPADGTRFTMGRSSASSDYQLGPSRFLSRVHVVATFKPALSHLEHDRVEILCTGWNRITLSCAGKKFEVGKDEKFQSDVWGADIMLDVCDARVLIKWPPKPHLGPASSDEEDSPSKRSRTTRRHSTPPSPSPLRPRQRLGTPVSPSPAARAANTMLPPSSPVRLPGSQPGEVVVYEDAPSPEKTAEDVPNDVSPSTKTMTQPSQPQDPASQESDLSPPQDFSDHDEENDPIIHSFGPFGANLNSRMASFNHNESPIITSPPKTLRPTTEPLQPTVSPPQKSSLKDEFDIKGHVINQLVFSRLSTTPLSTILSHLPGEAGSITKDDLATLIISIDCVGEVSREGKDAAGKRLESEYYYIPEADEDEKRKAAVTVMKPGVRSTRKEHKVGTMLPH